MNMRREGARRTKEKHGSLLCMLKARSRCVERLNFLLNKLKSLRAIEENNDVAFSLKVTSSQIAVSASSM